jgi:hypothetical protein
VWYDDDEHVDESLFEYVDPDEIDDNDLGLKRLLAGDKKEYATADEVPDQLRFVFNPIHDFDVVDDVTVCIDGEPATDIDIDEIWEDGCVEIRLYKDDIVSKGFSNWTFNVAFRDASDDEYIFVTDISKGTATLYDGTALDFGSDIEDQADKLTDDKILTAGKTYKYSELPKKIVIKVDPADDTYVVDSVGFSFEYTDKNGGGTYWVTTSGYAEEVLDSSTFYGKISNPQLLGGAGTYTVNASFVKLFDGSDTTGTYNLSADTQTNGTIRFSKSGFNSIADMEGAKIYFKPDEGYVLDSAYVVCPDGQDHILTLDTNLTPLAGNGIYELSADTAFLKDVGTVTGTYTWTVHAEFKPIISEQSITTAYAILPDTNFVYTASKFAATYEDNWEDAVFVQYLTLDDVPDEVCVLVTAPIGYDIVGLSVYMDGDDYPAALVGADRGVDLKVGNGSYLFVLDKSIFDKAGIYHIGPLVVAEPKG